MPGHFRMNALLAAALVSALLLGCSRSETPAHVKELEHAQSLAEQGEFDRAEKIASDLAERASDQEVGKQAKSFLAFELPARRAKQAAEQGRFAEAESKLTSISEQDLNPVEKAAMTGSLAAVKSARIAMSQLASEQFIADCRYLHVLLIEYQAVHGRFPETLEPKGFARLNAEEGPKLKAAFSAIKNYRVDENTFSLVAVSPDGESAVRITDKGVEQ